MHIFGCANQCHDIARTHGFYDGVVDNYNRNPQYLLGRLMLIVTEAAEAAEDIRKDRWDHVGEELADIVIRVFDTAVFMGIDIEDEIQRKMEINRTRPYKHGKNS